MIQMSQKDKEEIQKQRDSLEIDLQEFVGVVFPKCKQHPDRDYFFYK